MSGWKWSPEMWVRRFPHERGPTGLHYQAGLYWYWVLEYTTILSVPFSYPFAKPRVTDDKLANLMHKEADHAITQRALP